MTKEETSVWRTASGGQLKLTVAVLLSASGGGRKPALFEEGANDVATPGFLGLARFIFSDKAANVGAAGHVGGLQ